MKKLAVATIVTLFACASNAQTANFEGWSMGLNLDLLAGSAKATVTDVGVVDGLGKNSTGASLQGAYGFAVSPNTVISLGATYGLTSPTILDVSPGTIGNGVTAKLKDSYSVYVEPGYLISNSTLAYGKISYESAKLSGSNFTGEEKQSIHGTGLGFGIRTMIDKNLSLQVEVKRVGYNTVQFAGEPGVDFKTTTTVGTIGLGYKF